MSIKFDRESLADLKSEHLARAQGSDFLKLESDEPQAHSLLEKADEYFKDFVKGSPGGPCICCGKNQGAANLIDGLIGNACFTWGLAHGEGYCSNCGYPARAHHDVPEIGRITNLILQYHPDGLSFEKRKETEAV